MIIDAKNAILGRLATVAAKKALQGEDVIVVNCKSAIFIGNKTEVLAKFQRKRSMGTPRKGPFIHRSSEKIVKRVIRGMIPYKKPRGMEALKRVICHSGVPQEYEGKAVEIEGASLSRSNASSYTTVAAISKLLGAKNE